MRSSICRSASLIRDRACCARPPEGGDAGKISQAYDRHERGSPSARANISQKCGTSVFFLMAFVSQQKAPPLPSCVHTEIGHAMCMVTRRPVRTDVVASMVHRNNGASGALDAWVGWFQWTSLLAWSAPT